MNRTDAIKAVIRYGETDGWNVSYNIEQDKNITIFEFCKFTPAGQDFSFSATMKGNDLNSLIEDMDNYYESFDVDEETYLWLGKDGHGKNGAPYRMREVLEDMEAAEKMIEGLLVSIKKML